MKLPATDRLTSTIPNLAHNAVIAYLLDFISLNTGKAFNRWDIKLDISIMSAI